MPGSKIPIASQYLYDLCFATGAWFPKWTHWNDRWYKTPICQISRYVWIFIHEYVLAEVMRICIVESGYHILHREVYCSAFLLSLATTVLQLQILAAFTEVLLQGLFSSLFTRNFESVTRIFYGLFFFCFWEMNFESSKSSFFFPYSWSSLFFHFPSISNPKLHPPNSQSGAAGPLPELVLAWSNTTVSQNQFIICLTSCSSDLTDGYFFQSFGIRWLLCWGWMVEKRISLEGKHWTLGGETWALWWCLDVLDWWWTWILWVSSSRYLNLSWRCRIM